MRHCFIYPTTERPENPVDLGSNHSIDDSGYRRRRWAMVNLMKAKRFMRYWRANRMHLEEVAAVDPWILSYIIIYHHTIDTRPLPLRGASTISLLFLANLNHIHQIVGTCLWHVNQTCTNDILIRNISTLRKSNLFHMPKACPYKLMTMPGK